MIPADAEDTELTAVEIAEKYQVEVSTVHNWSRDPSFPSGRTVGAAGDLLVRDAQAVDDWLSENFPARWAVGQGRQNPHNLPDWGPKTLVSLKQIAEFEAKILGRDKPVPTATLRGYISKETMPGPDRTPGDGKRPEVTDRRWYWKTASAWLNRKRQRTKRPPRQQSGTR
ncbi:hypothetical protein OG800_49435 (plasmid) [Streptomyces sp. NBC_00445]|uniref:hypothetical protein n=1 Tax=Streptomyces sp. NBC_00445 TaxID=2975745 RepID=UPI002E1FF17E